MIHPAGTEDWSWTAALLASELGLKPDDINRLTFAQLIGYQQNAILAMKLRAQIEAASLAKILLPLLTR